MTFEEMIEQRLWARVRGRLAALAGEKAAELAAVDARIAAASAKDGPGPARADFLVSVRLRSHVAAIAALLEEEW